jgi:selenocysteine-specific elongation factor
VCERLHDSNTVIARGLFKKETPVEAYTGLKVSLSTGEQGVIEGGFGQTGKFKIRFMNALQPSTAALLAKKGKKGKKAAEEKEKDEGEGEEASGEDVKVILNFKRYLHDETKKMVQ